nr:hypothetical protein [Leptospira interrogans]
MKQFLRNIEVMIESPDGKVKVFSHNPGEAIHFSIEFEVEFSGTNVTSVALYNVLNSTVGMCTPREGKTKKDSANAKAELSVGYGEDLTLIAKGEIIQHKVAMRGADRIFEFKISDMVNKLYAYSVTETFEKTLVSSALKQIFEKYGISYYALRISDDVLLDSITFAGASLSVAIDRLAKLVKAKRYFKLGKLIVEDETWSKNNQSNNVPLLDRTSGLIGTPQKTKSGWKVQCLLNPLIAMGEPVHLTFTDNTTGSKIDSQYIVTHGTHKGSSRSSDHITEFECKVA